MNGARKIIPNEEKLNEILKNLRAGGSDNFQLILDFDGTITGIDAVTSWGVIESYNFSEEYLLRVKQLYNHYHPIEVDHTTPYEEKFKLMVEWWELAHGELAQQNLTRGAIKGVVEACQDRISFREKTTDVLDLIENHKVPCLVFSAGVGDTLVEILKLKNCLRSNMHVVSNFMVFDGPGEDAKLTGWNHPLIHVFNKSGVNMESKSYYKEIIGRKNAILVGDSPGDRHMADGLPIDQGHLLKIGLININDSPQRIEEFTSRYDIVLIKDNTFDVLLEILKSILV